MFASCQRSLSIWKLWGFQVYSHAHFTKKSSQSLGALLTNVHSSSIYHHPWSCEMGTRLLVPLTLTLLWENFLIERPPSWDHIQACGNCSYEYLTVKFQFNCSDFWFCEYGGTHLSHLVLSLSPLFAYYGSLFCPALSTVTPVILLWLYRMCWGTVWTHV